MCTIGAEHELYDCIVGWLWPGKSAELGARCGVPDRHRVAISAGREPLAVGAERERLKTPIVDCGKDLVRRARSWRGLPRRGFLRGHGKHANSWRCLLPGLLRKRRVRTERQRKTEKCQNFYESIPHLLDGSAGLDKKRYQSVPSLFTRSLRTRCNFTVDGAKWITGHLVQPAHR